jgi:phosphoribosylamine---glycine ligase
MTKIAILGSGGREHALAWKLGLDIGEENIYVIPGNGGTPNNRTLDPMDFKAVSVFCESEGINWLVVGPEDPLAQGIYDYFKGSSVKVFGPSKAAAQLEASKIYSKQFMKKCGVATARCFYSTEDEEPESFIRSLKGQVVVKYDGLAAGKGVTVCDSETDALEAIADLKEKYGKDAPYLLEERLIGREMSIIGITDGKTIRLLLPSQDHKQAYEGDRGPNTGGMGAYCPVPWYTSKMAEQVRKRVIEPTMRGIRKEGFEYKGVIYFGIMMTEDGPKVLEYNVRFGDPETEVILPALKSSLADLIEGALTDTLDFVHPEFYKDTFIDVVLASGGYPGKYEKGYEITGTDELAQETLLFHAGTKREGDKLVTNGGRVLNMVIRGKDLKDAIKKVYPETEKIHFRDKYLRRDIGQREGNV